MVKKYFALRVDVDGFVDLENGVPRILELLGKYQFPASFFLTLGREGNFFEFLRHIPRESSHLYLERPGGPKTRLKKLFDRRQEIFRMLFLPMDLSKSRILQRIKIKGHHVGLHSYIHARWRHITGDEITEEFKKMFSKYYRAYGEFPDSFASPYFQQDPVLLRQIDELGIKYASCLEGKYPFKPKGYKHWEIPVNTKMAEFNSPLIEYFARLGWDNDHIYRETTKIISDNMDKYGVVTTYVHPRIEGYYFSAIFDKLLRFIQEKKYTVVTYEQLANIYSK